MTIWDVDECPECQSGNIVTYRAGRTTYLKCLECKWDSADHIERREYASE